MMMMMNNNNNPKTEPESIYYILFSLVRYLTNNEDKLNIKVTDELAKAICEYDEEYNKMYNFPTRFQPLVERMKKHLQNKDYKKLYVCTCIAQWHAIPTGDVTTDEENWNALVEIIHTFRHETSTWERTTEEGKAWRKALNDLDEKFRHDRKQLDAQLDAFYKSENALD